MENKYQEALDNIINWTRTNERSQHEEDYANLQQLIDKETPLKVVKWKLAQPETRCANCGAGLEIYHNYCWGCGRKVDWSDEDA